MLVRYSVVESRATPNAAAVDVASGVVVPPSRGTLPTRTGYQLVQYTLDGSIARYVGIPPVASGFALPPIRGTLITPPPAGRSGSWIGKLPALTQKTLVALTAMAEGAVCRDARGTRHLPATQVPPQVTPHPPQLFTSFCPSTHIPLQTSGHTQTCP